MKKACLLTLAALLVVAMPLAAWLVVEVPQPVYADDIISITLSDPGSDGIDFGEVDPGSENVGDVLQDDGVPAVTVTVAPETDVAVDIGIMGTVTSGDLELSNWKYSQDFEKTTIASLTGSPHVAVYTNKVANDICAFYHWITVPAGTTAGEHTVQVSYKAVKTGDPF